MEFRCTVSLAAAQTAVWHTLTTPELISQCTPSLQGWTALDTGTQFQLQFRWGNGSSTILIPLLLTWQTVSPPDYLQWQAEAKLGSTAVPLQGTFQLNSEGTKQTNLAFTAQADPPNKLLAQMIQTAAPKFINSFFSCLKNTAWTV